MALNILTFSLGYASAHPVATFFDLATTGHHCLCLQPSADCSYQKHTAARVVLASVLRHTAAGHELLSNYSQSADGSCLLFIQLSPASADVSHHSSLIISRVLIIFSHAAAGQKCP